MGGAPACLPTRHKSRQSEPIVEQDLRFSLKATPEDWRGIPRSEIRGITADGGAGAQNMKTGVYGAIIVEQIPGVKLDAAAEEVRGNITLSDQKQTPIEATKVVGLESRRWMTT